MPIVCSRSSTGWIGLDIADAMPLNWWSHARGIAWRRVKMPALETLLQIAGIGMVGQIGRHQRREVAARRQGQQGCAGDRPVASAAVMTGGTRLGMMMLRANCLAVNFNTVSSHHAVAHMHMPQSSGRRIVMSVMGFQPFV